MKTSGRSVSSVSKIGRIQRLVSFLASSKDEGRTSFLPSMIVTTGQGRVSMANDRIVKLASGRLLCPLALSDEESGRSHHRALCFMSDDSGYSWHRGRGAVDLSQRSAKNPAVIELSDGRLLMLVQSDENYVAKTYSKDGGETWSEPGDAGISPSDSLLTLGRIPATGDLLLLRNNLDTSETMLGQGCASLSSVISCDEGQTWKHRCKVDEGQGRRYANASLLFKGDSVLMSYSACDNSESQVWSCFRAVPVRWLYDASE